MKKVKLIIGFGLVTLLWGCGQNNNRPSRSEGEAMSEAEVAVANEEQAVAEDMEAPPPNKSVSSSAAVVNAKDTTRKFIRTADLKFKVKNVIKSTYDIEEITSRQGGFVTSTELTSNIDNVSTSAVSIDSTLEATYYTVTNSMTLRVPNIKLDTTLKEISRNINFLDYRIIKAQDVALDILSNDLTQKRLKKNEKRLTDAIDNRGRKLNETATAEELLLSKQEEADGAKIANLSLTDQINFSTINLHIYQRQTVKYELTSNNQNIEVYTPNLGIKLLEALKFGWDMLEELILFLVKIWGILLFGLLVYLIYKNFRHKFKK